MLGHLTGEGQPGDELEGGPDATWKRRRDPAPARGGRGVVPKVPPPRVTCAPRPMAASELTLGTGRGSWLASPGQRASPAPCDSGLWVSSRLFGHGEWRPARACRPRPYPPGSGAGSRDTPLGSGGGEAEPRPAGRWSRTRLGGPLGRGTWGAPSALPAPGPPPCRSGCRWMLT